MQNTSHCLCSYILISFILAILLEETKIERWQESIRLTYVNAELLKFWGHHCGDPFCWFT